MITRAQTGAPPRLPGKCGPIPRVRAEVLDSRGRVGWVAETRVVPGLDLDGYESPVVLVPADRSGLNRYSMWWRLFIQRGDCGHELGVIDGMGDPLAEPGESCGLRNFSVVNSTPDTGDGYQGIGITLYTFDGARYTGGRTEYR